MQIVIRTFTIWVLTALINAVMSACCLAFSDTEFNVWILAFLLTLFFTLLFSVPAVFIFFIFFAATSKSDTGHLFRVLLVAGFVTAVASAVAFYFAFYYQFKTFTIFLTLSIVISAISSIMLHHKFIAATCKSNMPP
jgi:drug/metabolite transporter (DMT)-like permease